MCDAIDELMEDSKEEGKTEAQETIAKNMLLMKKFNDTDIAEASGLSLDTVQALAEQLRSA